MSKRKEPPNKDNKSIQTKKKPPNMFTGLAESMKDPKLIVKSDDKIVVIKDKYPKAKNHFLVLPRENISSIKVVSAEHLELLEHMHKIGLELTKMDSCKDSTFKLGYHSEPSMSRLHLHVISDDMISDCLKTKKHWKSFTTEFFIKSEDVILSLKNNSKIPLLSREQCKHLLGTPLQCHKCTTTSKTMPELKRHILAHQK